MNSIYKQYVIARLQLVAYRELMCVAISTMSSQSGSNFIEIHAPSRATDRHADDMTNAYLQLTTHF